MKTLTLSLAIASIFVFHSAFARNLGTLDNDHIPQNLIQAGEYSNYLKSPDAQKAQVNHAQSARPENSRHEDRNNWGWDDWGWGYGGYYGSYYPYYYGSYYYPYYGYGYGYGSYYPYYGYWLDGNNSGNHATVHNQNRATGPSDAAHVPVVCFASDSTGNWFANADLASNVAKTQESANRECLNSDGHCNVNLGCAIALPEEPNHS